MREIVLDTCRIKVSTVFVVFQSLNTELLSIVMLAPSPPLVVVRELPLATSWHTTDTPSQVLEFQVLVLVCFDQSNCYKTNAHIADNGAAEKRTQTHRHTLYTSLENYPVSSVVDWCPLHSHNLDRTWHSIVHPSTVCSRLQFGLRAMEMTVELCAVAEGLAEQCEEVEFYNHQQLRQVTSAYYGERPRAPVSLHVPHKLLWKLQNTPRIGLAAATTETGTHLFQDFSAEGCLGDRAIFVILYKLDAISSGNSAITCSKRVITIFNTQRCKR